MHFAMWWYLINWIQGITCNEIVSLLTSSLQFHGQTKTYVDCCCLASHSFVAMLFDGLPTRRMCNVLNLIQVCGLFCLIYCWELTMQQQWVLWSVEQCNCAGIDGLVLNGTYCAYLDNKVITDPETGQPVIEDNVTNEPTVTRCRNDNEFCYTLWYINPHDKMHSTIFMQGELNNSHSHSMDCLLFD